MYSPGRGYGIERLSCCHAYYFVFWLVYLIGILVGFLMEGSYNRASFFCMDT